jgi:heme A synthase
MKRKQIKWAARFFGLTGLLVAGFPFLKFDDGDNHVYLIVSIMCVLVFIVLQAVLDGTPKMMHNE